MFILRRDYFSVQRSDYAVSGTFSPLRYVVVDSFMWARCSVNSFLILQLVGFCLCCALTGPLMASLIIVGGWGQTGKVFSAEETPLTRTCPSLCPRLNPTEKATTQSQRSLASLAVMEGELIGHLLMTGHTNP